jgi:acid phosphatase type 7
MWLRTLPLRRRETVLPALLAMAMATATHAQGDGSGKPAVLVGAGDIAECGSPGHNATADLLDAIPGTVFTAGDNAYGDGTAEEFAQCYHPSWGRHKARTRPSPGNHDYETRGGAAYYAYFGANAGPAGRGYYSYDLGDWHIVSLNSNVSMRAGSPQEKWLRADLATTTKQCVLAYWHHPRFSSSSKHGSQRQTQPLWEALYEHGAEIVIGGHDHTYERFAPQTPDGKADPRRGIRQFVVGTGGKGHYGFGQPLPNSEARDNTSDGVLKLTLERGTYSWTFVPIAGNAFTDSGTGTCH